MNTFKTALALILAAGLNTAAFAQTTPTSPSGTVPTTPGTTTTGRDVNQTTHGNATMNNGTVRDGDMQNGTMQNANGTMRTRTGSTDRRMKTKGNMTNGKSKMKAKPMN
ncbi:hypothetical protein MON38_18615 [Hymenobacter sp. DH14]|uniref:Uncharacterized protein n=1 Tax=Hymenobacter cyanobacteriorum TaxID=2926463 RepID=A0A9X2AGN7_9BACT|nr:hypothetical protein [Hymenobacter cyanobacteriorum]MCI1189441.1 hypothetical protein [Hymenobacter cyanobacteriorum]